MAQDNIRGFQYALFNPLTSPIKDSRINYETVAYNAPLAASEIESRQQTINNTTSQFYDWKSNLSLIKEQLHETDKAEFDNLSNQMITQIQNEMAAGNYNKARNLQQQQASELVKWTTHRVANNTAYENWLSGLDKNATEGKISEEYKSYLIKSNPYKFEENKTWKPQTDIIPELHIGNLIEMAYEMISPDRQTKGGSSSKFYNELGQEVNYTEKLTPGVSTARTAPVFETQVNTQNTIEQVDPVQIYNNLNTLYKTDNLIRSQVQTKFKIVLSTIEDLEKEKEDLTAKIEQGDNNARYKLSQVEYDLLEQKKLISRNGNGDMPAYTLNGYDYEAFLENLMWNDLVTNRGYKNRSIISQKSSNYLGARSSSSGSSQAGSIQNETLPSILDNLNTQTPAGVVTMTTDIKNNKNTVDSAVSGIGSILDNHNNNNNNSQNTQQSSGSYVETRTVQRQYTSNKK